MPMRKVWLSHDRDNHAPALHATLAEAAQRNNVAPHPIEIEAPTMEPSKELIEKRAQQLTTGIDDLHAALEVVAEQGGVESVDEYQAVAALLLEVKARANVVNDEYDAFVADAKRLIERVKGWLKPAVDRHTAAESLAKDLLSKWLLSRAEQAAELRAKALNAKSQAAANKLFDQANALEEAPKVRGVAVAASSNFEIVDAAVLPEGFFTRVPDCGLIKAALAAGHNVPGVRVTHSRVLRITPPKGASKLAEVAE